MQIKAFVKRGEREAKVFGSPQFNGLTSMADRHISQYDLAVFASLLNASSIWTKPFAVCNPWCRENFTREELAFKGN